METKSDLIENLLIGSGPTALACARGLLDQGQSVTIFDKGDQIPVELRDKIKKAASVSHKDLKETALRLFNEDKQPLERKKVFGSDFPYSAEMASDFLQSGTKCNVSGAFGGFSNVWGAAILPNEKKEFEKWPISFLEMQEAYSKVAEVFQFPDPDHRLGPEFLEFESDKTYSKAFHQSDRMLSRQAQWVLESYNLRKKKLLQAGIFIGRSSLALKNLPGHSKGCELCQLCLIGCPFGVVFNSRLEFEKIFKNSETRKSESKSDCSEGRLSYFSQIMVEKIHEVNGLVHVEFIRNTSAPNSNGVTGTVVAKRVFVAAGVLGTLRIMKRSIPRLLQIPLGLHYQPYFMIPVFFRKGFKDIKKEKLHSLSQVFIEVRNEQILKTTVHLQLYGYNAYYENQFKRMTERSLFSFMRPIAIKLFERLLLGRLGVIQGYLHSDTVVPIEVRSENSSEAGGSRRKILLTAPGKSVTIRIAKIGAKVGNLLFKNRKGLGFIPLNCFLKVGVPGDGNHIGGVFPMSENPIQGFETDSKGRPFGLKNVHLVDASVLPSLPSTTITFTAMANAYRIAKRVVLEERREK